MEILIVLVGLYVFYLSRRIDGLRKEIQALKLRGVVTPEHIKPQIPLYEPATFDMQVENAEVPVTPPFTPAAYTTSEPDSFDVIAWLQKDFLVKVGAFLLLLAFGWFVSYAFANNWVGEAGRIALGILAGVICMLIGVWRLSHSAHQAGIFTVLGAGVVVMTVFTARMLYDLFTPTSALLVMFLAVAFVAFMAIKARSQGLAICGLLIGAAAPFLTNTPDPSVMGLFSYLAVIIVASVWVMWLLRSVALPLVALVIVTLYGLPYMSMGMNEEVLVALVWSFGFTALFFTCSLLSLSNRLEPLIYSGQLILAGGTGLYVTLWIAVAAPEVWQAALYSIWMVVFSFGAFVLYQKTRDLFPFYIYTGVSLILLGAATAALLEGPLLTVAYIIEVLVLVVLATKLPVAPGVAQRACYLYVLPILLSFEHLTARSWRETNFLHEDFFVLLLLTFALGLSALVVWRTAPVEVETPESAPSILVAMAGLYTLALVWLVTHSLLADDAAVLVSLVIYTVGGIALYVHGVSSESRFVKTSGVILIGFVVTRLLLVDVWEMDLAGRIVTFFVVGVLLMSTAFMRKFNQK